MMSDTGKPSSAYFIAGCRRWDSGMVPQLSSRVSHPWTAPGTVTEWTPLCGIVVCPSAFSASIVASMGARPLPLIARTLFSSLFHIRANMSPPTPVDTGSTTLSTAALAMAASTALPPSIRTRTPAIAARGWLVATIPWVARTVERLESKYIACSRDCSNDKSAAPVISRSNGEAANPSDRSVPPF